MITSTSLRTTGDVEVARVAAARLSSALALEGFVGWDPYDALASRYLRHLARNGTLQTVAIQALKRSPVNLRPLLRVPKRTHSKALALLVSGYARLAQSEASGTYRRYAQLLSERLVACAIERPSGCAWGYDFDVKTRWGYYRAGEPNVVVTSFAAHALLDVARAFGWDDVGISPESILSFLREELTVQGATGSFFSYYPGSAVPIHNANLLAASVFARMGLGAEACARDAVAFTISRQNADGSWAYGEAPGLGWIDGFHTAYVLESLVRCNAAAQDNQIRGALARGTAYYLDNMFEADWAPRPSPSRRYPIDIHAAASAIRVLAMMGSACPRSNGAATHVLRWTLASMARSDGRFAYQRRRVIRVATPYVRWSDGHMLLALASYVKSHVEPPS